MTLLLAFVLTLSSINYVYADESVQIEHYTVYEDGVQYNIDLTKKGDNYDFVVASDSSEDYYEVIIDKSESEIEYTEYKYNSDDSYDQETTEVDYDQVIDVENACNFMSQGISYGNTTKEKLSNDHYWYCYGSNGTKTYMKVGCTSSTYRIRTDNLASAKEKKCDKYASEIRSCNSNVNKALACVGGSSAMLGVIAGLVAANVAFPPSVIVTIVVAALGGGAGVVGCVNYVIDAYTNYTTAADLYVTIRTYGTKL